MSAELEVLITPDALQSMIHDAYVAGCDAVHANHHPDDTDPDFTEAGYDYVASLDFTTTTRPARAEGPAPVSAPLDREAIARVIETTYWPLVDKWGRNTSNEYWNTRIEASLAKADAILALTGQQDHVGLTTPAVLGEPDIDGLPSQPCADGSLPVLKDAQHSDEKNCAAFGHHYQWGPDDVALNGPMICFMCGAPR